MPSSSRSLSAATSDRQGLRLVLASRSPQRDAILRQLGIPFRSCVSRHAEAVDAGGGDRGAIRTVRANATGKAREVAARARPGPTEVVLGVDTIVLIDGNVLGKASNEGEAAQYLRALSGRTHEVFSGLCLIAGGREEGGHARTEVRFRPLTKATIEAYVSSGEWRERAGAYAIQGVGSALVESIRGDYFNVVGLPVPLLIAKLASLGWPPLEWGIRA